MTTRRAALWLSIGLAGANQTHRTVSDAEAASVHRSALLIDTHNDVPSRTAGGFDIGSRGASGHTDIERLRSGGVGAVFLSAYVSAHYAATGQSAHRALEMIDTILNDIVARYPDHFALAGSAAEIEAIHRSGKIAALIGLEGGHAIEDSPRLLRNYYRLGVRYMTLTHTNTNAWADSSGDQGKPGVVHHNGLTAAGREIIAEMNRLGMMIDISHVADQTFWDVLGASRVPVIASHSSCRALAPAARNMTDEMIAALAKQGGVIQINFSCDFLRAAASPRATLDDVVAHIEHAVKIGGIGVVGIGSDFDGIGCTPAGLDDVSRFPALTRALLERGFRAAEIRQIYGENLLRVMRAVEAGRGAR